NGNVALVAEIDLQASGGEFDLLLGFGRRYEEAGHRVIATLRDGSESCLTEYVRQWREWQVDLLPLDAPHDSAVSSSPYRVSTAVIRSHEAASFPGGFIA